MEQILNEILSKLNNMEKIQMEMQLKINESEKTQREIQSKLNESEKTQREMQSKLNESEKLQIKMQSNITDIKGKVNAIYNQTADLTEFRTESKDNFTNVSNDVKLIKHKLNQTEEDVFVIKDHFKLIK